MYCIIRGNKPTRRLGLSCHKVGPHVLFTDPFVEIEGLWLLGSHWSSLLCPLSGHTVIPTQPHEHQAPQIAYSLVQVGPGGAWWPQPLSY